MLALQDYSQGISKLADVLSQLNSHRAETERELEKLRFDAKGLEEAIAELGTHAQTEPMPIESALDDLRKELVFSSVQGSSWPPRKSYWGSYRLFL
jgi:chromosome segregation ATPase